MGRPVYRWTSAKRKSPLCLYLRQRVCGSQGKAGKEEGRPLSVTAKLPAHGEDHFGYVVVPAADGYQGIHLSAICHADPAAHSALSRQGPNQLPDGGDSLGLYEETAEKRAVGRTGWPFGKDGHRCGEHSEIRSKACGAKIRRRREPA